MDRFISLPNDILFFILSFLTIKQCVALSALCCHFRRRLPSLIPRLDTYRLDIGDDIPQKSTTPSRTLIRQFRIVFHDFVTGFPKRLKSLLDEDLVAAGVRDLIVESSSNRCFILSTRQLGGIFGIKSVRNLSLLRIIIVESSGNYDRRPPSAFPCTNLTSLKIELCVLHVDILLSLLASCPFLKTLQLICCYGFDRSIDKLSIHSASLKHLVLLYKVPGVRTIDVHAPKLEYLVVNVVTALCIEAPKIQNASFLLDVEPQEDLPDALMTLFGAAFPTRAGWLMLNSSTTPDILATGNEIDEFVEYKEEALFLKLDFNLKDQSSTMLLTKLLKKCNKCNTEFDIRVDSAHIESIDETVIDDHLLHGLIELIKLQMRMSNKTFEGFLSTQKKMTEKLKHVALQKLKSCTKRELSDYILASKKSLFEVSSRMTNCIEIKF